MWWLFIQVGELNENDVYLYIYIYIYVYIYVSIYIMCIQVLTSAYIDMFKHVYIWLVP